MVVEATARASRIRYDRHVHPRDRTPSPPPMEPAEDVTPLRTMVPDYDRFPCERCGHMNRCPPVARPANKTTTALKIRRREEGIIAPELDPDRGEVPTRILNPPKLPDA